MNAESIGARLKLWRRANMVKQSALAHDLGVTQAAVSRWENELDMPSATMVRRLQDLLTRTNDSALPERRFIERQSTVRALFDFDGVRLIASSKGCSALWPGFSEMTEVPLADSMVGETASLIHERDYQRQIRRGELVVVSGVSERHVSLKIDQSVRHRWHICLRPFGARMLADMVFEPCDRETPTGIESSLYIDALMG